MARREQKGGRAQAAPASAKLGRAPRHEGSAGGVWDPVREGTDGSRRVTIFIAATMPEHKQWQLMEKGHTILRPSLSPNSFDTIF